MSRQRFDPYAILRELENPRTFFVVIGGLARVIQGSDELTEGLDIAPSLSQENLRRLGRALENMNARRVDGQPLDITDLNLEIPVRWQCLARQQVNIGTGAAHKQDSLARLDTGVNFRGKHIANERITKRDQMHICSKQQAWKIFKRNQA